MSIEAKNGKSNEYKQKAIEHLRDQLERARTEAKKNKILARLQEWEKAK
jgi:hypothetical protein